MYNLHILDVSALLHFGMNSSKYCNKYSCTYPVGGIHKVMYQAVIALVNKDDVIFVFDSKNNFRKAIMPEYKAGRVANKMVLSQAELLYERLPQIGFSCYKVDGYEGDDIINWCTNLAPKYYNVYIHGNDKDLAHNVRGNIIFHSINENINSITEANFQYAIDKNVQIPFNFLALHKVLLGCKSDKVPSFTSENGLSGKDIFEWYREALDVKHVPAIYENTTNPDLFMMFMHAITDLTDNDFKELEKRIKIIFPAKAPDDFEAQGVGLQKINKELLAGFLSYVNDYNSLKSLKLYRRDLTADECAELKERQRKLSSGEFAVDRNMVVNDSFDDSLLCLKEF